VLIRIESTRSWRARLSTSVVLVTVVVVEEDIRACRSAREGMTKWRSVTASFSGEGVERLDQW
jgi:hypothetical protein